jgi:hypothetical protein
MCGHSVRPRTFVYVDGFNLYYGCFRAPQRKHWAKYKWLDLERLCDWLFPRNDVVSIRYYTADVSNRPPDNHQGDRQRVYLAALSTLPGVQIIKGHFLGPQVVRMPRCDANGHFLGEMVTVLKTEEKGSDVNLAVDLLCDCAGPVRVRDHHLQRLRSACADSNCPPGVREEDRTGQPPSRAAQHTAIAQR